MFICWRFVSIIRPFLFSFIIHSFALDNIVNFVLFVAAAAAAAIVVAGVTTFLTCF